MRLRIGAMVSLAACMLSSAGVAASKGKYFEAAVIPTDNDNFYEARARMWLPEDGPRIRAVLTVLGGTDCDWRGIVSEQQWQEVARNNGLALVGVYFRGGDLPYDQAAGGSGAALLNMLDQLGDAANVREIQKAPLMIAGHSFGAMFAYNFVRWRPELIAGFISVKTGSITTGTDKRIARIPGLFVVGENDYAERIKISVNAFAWQRQIGNGRWALAVEPNHGHEWTSAITSLVGDYVNGVLAPQPPVAPDGIWSSLSAPSDSFKNAPKYTSDAVWLPNQAAFESWRRFTRKISITEVVKNAEEFERSKIELCPTNIDLGVAEISSTSTSEVSRIVKVKSGTHEKLQCLFESSDPRLALIADAQSDSSYKLTIKFKPNCFSAGTISSSIYARFFSKGIEVGGCPVLITGRVASSYRITPPSLLLGVVGYGQRIEKRINITSPDGQEVHLREVKSSRPDFASASVVNPSPSAPAGVLCRFDTTKVRGNQSGYFDLIIDAPRYEHVRILIVAHVSNKRFRPESNTGGNVGQ